MHGGWARGINGRRSDPHDYGPEPCHLLQNGEEERVHQGGFFMGFFEFDPEGVARDAVACEHVRHVSGDAVSASPDRGAVTGELVGRIGPHVMYVGQFD